MTSSNNLNAVWGFWKPECKKPARAFGEARLAREALRVEITNIAAIRD